MAMMASSTFCFSASTVTMRRISSSSSSFSRYSCSSCRSSSLFSPSRRLPSSFSSSSSLFSASSPCVSIPPSSSHSSYSPDRRALCSLSSSLFSSSLTSPSPQSLLSSRSVLPTLSKNRFLSTSRPHSPSTGSEEGGRAPTTDRGGSEVSSAGENEGEDEISPVSRQKRSSSSTPGGEQRPKGEDLRSASGEKGEVSLNGQADEAYKALEEKYMLCMEEVEEHKKKAKEMKDKALRALADMENARMRHQKEMSSMKEYAVGDFAKAVLDVADSLAYATKSLQDVLDRHQKEGETGEETNTGGQQNLTLEHIQQIYDGVKMTETLLHKTLDRFGVKQFDPMGEKFNPALHEALFELEHPTKEKGEVAQVIQKGYKIKDRVLRAAKVGVAKGAAAGSSNGSNNN